MLIHVAEDGRSFDLPCTSETLADTVISSLHALTGIPPDSQLLICGESRIEAGRTLGFYRLPDDVNPLRHCRHMPVDSHGVGSISSSSSGGDGGGGWGSGVSRGGVFLYNKSRLLPRAQPPPVEPLPDFTPRTITPADLHMEEHPLDKSPNPLLRTLPSYERQFRADLLQGQALLNASQQRFTASRRLVQEVQTQAMALRTACSSMEATGRLMCRSFLDFQSDYGRQRDRHRRLLLSFERDLGLLRACPLPAQLRESTGLRTLADLVRDGRLRAAYAECHAAHSQMEAKVGELESQFEELKAGLERMLTGLLLEYDHAGGDLPGGGRLSGHDGRGAHDGGGVSDVAGVAEVGRSRLEACRDVDSLLRALELGMQEGHGCLEEEEAAINILSKDLGTVAKVIRDCLLSLSSASGHNLSTPSPSESPRFTRMSSHNSSGTGGGIGNSSGTSTNSSSNSSSSSSSSQSLQPIEAVAALDPLCTLHTSSILPRITACDARLASIAERAHAAKRATTLAAHAHMQLVARLQSRIRDVRNQLHAFREAMARQDSLFEEIAVVRVVREAYAACLAEVVRRHEWKRGYAMRAHALAEEIGRVREEEVARRHRFTRTQVRFGGFGGNSSNSTNSSGSSSSSGSGVGGSLAFSGLPPEILTAMGLGELPAPCQVSIHEFDSGLIQISHADIPTWDDGITRAGAAKGRDGLCEEDYQQVVRLGEGAATFSSMYGLSSETMTEVNEEKESPLGDCVDRSFQEAGDECERLRLENLRLRAELAALKAAGAGEPSSMTGRTGGAVGAASAGSGVIRSEAIGTEAEAWADALRRKDELLQEMIAAAAEQQQQAAAYEVRIRELEAALQEQVHRAGSSELCGLRSGLEGEPHQVSGGDGMGLTAEGESDGQGRGMGARGGGGGSWHDEGMEHSSSCVGGKDVYVHGDGDSDGDGGLPDLKGCDGDGSGSGGAGNVSTGSVVMGTCGDSEVCSQRVKSFDGMAGGSEQPGEAADGSVTDEQAMRSSPQGKQEQQQEEEVEHQYLISSAAAKEAAALTDVVAVAASVREQEGHAGAAAAAAAATAGEAVEAESEVDGLRSLVEQQRQQLDQQQQILEQQRQQLEQAQHGIEELQHAMQQKDSLLAECQLNCAHLENKLHEAREEARTHLCSAERRATDYSALRVASVHTRALLERFARCLLPAQQQQQQQPGLGGSAGSSPSSLESDGDMMGDERSGESTEGARAAGRSGLLRAEVEDCLKALRAFASSLAAASDGSGRISVLARSREVDSEEWVKAAIRVVVDKIVYILEHERAQRKRLEGDCAAQKGQLERATAALMELCSKLEATKHEVVNRVAFARFQVQDLAVFARTPAGHYEAVSAPSAKLPRHFLSPQSLALVHSPSPSGAALVGEGFSATCSETTAPTEVVAASSAAVGGGSRAVSSQMAASTAGQAGAKKESSGVQRMVSSMSTSALWGSTSTPPSAFSVVVGRIVHIERRRAGNSASIRDGSAADGRKAAGGEEPADYGLLPGTPYAVVNIALLADALMPHNQ